jgi:uncharacterized protein YyaL (SSP411 family)
LSENRLRFETSPYLRQHQDNPVHWQAWGEAALAEARARGVPVLLSVGYAACHWCHVMAHESFEDEATAALMNADFVCVKVDREERPDIDHIYMSALHAMGEQGGWPLTMFLTPAGEPFWGGTYFPPAPRWGKPSFRQVLGGIARAWAEEGEAIRRNTASLTGALTAMSAERPGSAPGAAMARRVAVGLGSATDPVHGGLRGAPKFPNPPIFCLLWQAGGEAGRQEVVSLLQHMSAGGIYDHLGGGYARYSTDAEWLVPHFEKMLYDNAQILELLAYAQAVSPEPVFAERAAETVGWLLRDMRAGGAFAASEDADSEGVEGKFYVWTLDEVRAVLGAAAEEFAAAYDVTASGNWEGHTILRRVLPRGDAAYEARLAAGRARLLAARSARVRPGRDGKVLADWNGLLVAGLARAGLSFGRADWVTLAAATFRVVDEAMGGADGRVAHAWMPPDGDGRGRITASGMLDDQAAMARAALVLFQATGEDAYLDRARGLVAAAEAWFRDGNSYAMTASDAGDVPLLRPRTVADNATPAGNGMMAQVLATLHLLTGEPEFAARAEAMLASFGGMENGLAAAPTLLAAGDLLERGRVVVIAGEAPQEASGLLAVALAAQAPDLVVLRAGDRDAPVLHPAHGKLAGGPAAYLCSGGVCGLPIRDPAALAAALGG